MSDSPPQPRPRCFYCDSLLSEKKARIIFPGGQLFGPCCEDILFARREQAVRD